MEQKLPFTLEELNAFYNKAAASCYAGDAQPDATAPNFNCGQGGLKRYKFDDLEGGRFSYIDTYAGFFQSFGQEMIYFEGQAVWVQNYGGEMNSEIFASNQGEKIALAHKTFAFLKKVLSQKGKFFRPRGPREFQDGEFTYTSRPEGGIAKFRGEETIFVSGLGVVFEHSFHGGLIRWKE